MPCRLVILSIFPCHGKTARVNGEQKGKNSWRTEEAFLMNLSRLRQLKPPTIDKKSQKNTKALLKASLFFNYLDYINIVSRQKTKPGIILGISTNPY